MKLADRLIEIVGCEVGRIAKPYGRMFFIAGWKKRSEGEWLRNGEPWKFDYVQEKVVASGETEAELLESAREYKRLTGVTMLQYLQEKTGVQLEER